MKVIVKQLQGGQCILEVSPTTTIFNMKQQIHKELNIPVSSQKLVHLGKALIDEKEIGSYSNIKDGTKLMLVVKEPDALFEVALKEFKKMGLSNSDALGAAKRLPVVMEKKINQLSWDDLERLSKDILLVEAGVRQLRLDRDNLDELL